METLQGSTVHSVPFIEARTQVVIETTNGGRTFGTLSRDYRVSYPVFFVNETSLQSELIPAGRIRDVRPLTRTERLLAWIRDHCHHAHICADGSICVGIATIHRDGTRSTTLEYVRTVGQARDALGY